MDTWILQGGHPIVRVGSDGLAQRPFMFAPPRLRDRLGLARARAVARASTAASRQLLAGAAALEATAPAIVNAGGTGVYRTSYGPASLGRSRHGSASLAEIERAVLLGDTWALARAGDGRWPTC